MKQFFVFLTCVLFAFTWSGVAQRDAGALKTAQLNTRAFACDGQRHELDAGLENVRVRKIVVWFGAWDWTNADIVADIEQVNARGEWHSIGTLGYDHYATPTGISNQVVTYDFAPDWISLAPREKLLLEAQCNPMNAESQTKKAHVIVTIYYLE